jgi:hypothetical protein
MIAPSPESSAWPFYVVAQVCRAAVGLLSSEVVGMAAEITADAVVIHSAVTRPSEELRDDLDHVCFELDVLLDGHVMISHEEHVGVDRPWPPVGWHPIYVAKPGRESDENAWAEGT